MYMISENAVRLSVKEGAKIYSEEPIPRQARDALDKGIKLAEAGIKLAKNTGLATAPELMGSLLCARAQGLTLKARFEEALACADEAVLIYRDLGCHSGETYFFKTSGNAAFHIYFLCPISIFIFHTLVRASLEVTSWKPTLWCWPVIICVRSSEWRRQASAFLTQKTTSKPPIGPISCAMSQNLANSPSWLTQILKRLRIYRGSSYCILHFSGCRSSRWSFGTISARRWHCWRELGAGSDCHFPGHSTKNIKSSGVNLTAV